MKIEEFLELYKETDDPKLNQVHLIKSRRIEDEGWPTASIYTDGSSKGSNQSHDQRSFSGWGMYMLSETSGGNAREFNLFGNMFNSDILEAELKAVVESLKNIRMPLHVRLVTDSAYVVKGISSLEQRAEEKRDIEAIPEVERESWQWKDYRRLCLWEELGNIINNSPKLLSLEVSWIRAHTLDNAKSFPDPESGRTEAEKQLIKDCLGNYKADLQANLGAEKQIRSAIWMLHTMLKDEKNYSKVARGIATCRKNFSNSSFSRNEAIKFLGSQGPDFLPREVMLSILDDKTVVLIDGIHITKAKEEEENNKVSFVKSEINVSTSPFNKEENIKKFQDKYSGMMFSSKRKSQEEPTHP